MSKGLAAAPACGVSGFGIAPVRFNSAASNYEAVSHATALNASLVKKASNRSTGYAVPSSEALLRFAGEVSLDQVIRVRRKPFSGHVYNLQTITGWYIANDIVIHNCRCVIIPAHEPPDQFVERLRQWMDRPGSQPDIERWYTGTAKRFVSRSLLAFACGGRGGGSGSGGVHPVDRLIQELADTGREVTPAELQQIREHVASAMFSPQAATRPGSRGVGKMFRGRQLTSQDRLTAGEAHYVWHLQEWPEGTSYTDYLRGIAEVVRDSATGVALTRYKNELQASFLRRSGNLRGPAGNEWLLVDYRPSASHIVTAYQPKAETRREFERRVIRWLQTPR